MRWSLPLISAWRWPDYGRVTPPQPSVINSAGEHESAGIRRTPKASPDLWRSHSSRGVWRVPRLPPAPCTHLQSQRDCVLQPSNGVARHELPWVRIRKTPSTPTGLRRCSPRPNPACLKRHNSFGVEVPTRLLPRVARASQPWALRRNPFGILHWPTPPKMRLRCGSSVAFMAAQEYRCTTL